MTAGFGIEKLGLVSLRRPWVCIALAVIVTPFLAYGANRLGFSSDVREIFQSESAAFAALDEVDALFPGSEREVQVVVEGGDLLSREALRSLRALHDRLGEIEGVSDVASLFSAVRPPGSQGAGGPVIPRDLGAVEDLGALREAVLDHPFVKDKLLSPDGSLAVFAVGLEGSDRSAEESGAAVERIRQETAAALEGSDLTARLTGLAVMRGEIVGALIRDQQVLRYGALAVGLFLCFVAFRKLRYVLIAGAPAALSVTWLLGLMWLAGKEVNVLTNVIPTIVLVIAFSDSVHLMFAVRDGLEAGKPLRQAAEEMVHDVMPACILTVLTAATALGSLVFIEHQFIFDFAVISSAGAGLALIANLVVLPAMTVLLLPGIRTPRDEKEKDFVRRGIEALSRWSAAVATAAPRTITVASVLVTLAATWAHSLNEPMYSYAGNLPRDNPAYDAVTAINRELAGANSVKVLLDWPEEHDFASPQTLEAVRAVEQALEEQEAFASAFSLATIVDWLGPRAASEAGLARLLGQESPAFVETVASPEEKAALVTARFGDLAAAELAPPLDALERRLAEIEDDYPGLDATVTGLVPISARASYVMIQQLNGSLLLAISFIILLIALGLGSVASGAASILPNVLPVALGGLFLYLTGDELQFTSVIAFTIGFGLAVDSTIHTLNRYRIERERAPDLKTAIRRSMIMVGPVVVISTVVVASALGVAMFSELPMVRLYGQVAVLVLVTSLAANLLVLPAVLTVIERWRGKT